MTRTFLAGILALFLSAPLSAQELQFAWGDHPTVRAGDWLRIDFRARIQGDMRASEATTDGDADGALDIARRRVGIEGRVARIVDYQVEYEVSSHRWRDVYLDYRQFKAVRIRAGKFKLPFGLDENTSATNLDFIYRSRIASRLAPGRDRGAMVHGKVLNEAIAYEAGVFQHDGNNARPSASARVFGRQTSAARLSIAPFRHSKSALADFHAGVAVSGTTIPEGFSAIRARTVLGASFFDSDVWVKGRRQRTGLEARWRPGPFSVQAEYIRLTDERRGQGVEDGDLSPLVAEGWYVSGTLAITGERKSDGLDTPQRPFHPFSKWGGLGAIEVTARFETLGFGSAGGTGNLSTSTRADNVLGNSDRALTFGVNWYLNRWMKIQANLIRERLHEPSMGPVPGRASFLSRVFRFQFTL
jgi:phosphate-selective porin OprO/OprP